VSGEPYILAALLLGDSPSFKLELRWAPELALTQSLDLVGNGATISQLSSLEHTHYTKYTHETPVTVSCTGVIPHV